ncbi:MAG: UDP-N-acetylmuramoyl-L-alanyl-D-glutamate--2,6-diaminopimelate ligase, partial [Actinobacteria bacterium]|nr:UDP-N-acetylmuramoyl-L-alanyl-D-glutamate--2,6-diaminopimelate ligase [Actinomycetota bacterium]
GRKLLSSSDAQQIVTVGATGDWKISNVSTDLAGHTKFELSGPGSALKVSVPMFGQFNATNAALCLAAGAALGLEPKALVHSLESLPQVPGRMQVVSQFNGATAIVDYAHTPDAVEKVLTQLRQANPAKIITVLGCGGNRDAGKRPVMGQVAAQLSDVLVVTDDNPRFESPEDIRAAMINGAVGHLARVIEIGDRRDAIREAITLATEGSVVAVLGKGHELGQEVNGVISDFDDCAVIRSEVSCLN